MKDETIEDQNELIDLIEQAGYTVSKVNTREHEIDRGENETLYDVAIEILVSTEYVEGDGFENPYRLK